MRTLKKDTPANIMVLMTDSITHVLPKPGLTLTVNLSKAGGAFSPITTTVTDRGRGWYNIELTSVHTNTIGELVLSIDGGPTADPSDIIFLVQVINDNDVYSLLNDIHALLHNVDTFLQTIIDPKIDDHILISKSADDLVKEIHTIQGLNPSKPSTTTPSNWIAGDIEILISGDGTTTTTMTRQP